MNTLKEYTKLDNCIVVGIFDENKLIGFTVADLNMERACEKNFEIASLAIQWANSEYKSLIR